MKYPDFSGVHTALVTPFCKGELDEKAYREHIKRQIAGGVQGIAPIGTTGESPTIKASERRQLISWAKEEIVNSGQSTLLIPGTGSNNTEQSVNWSKEAEELGADALLVVAPYYNKPSPSGIYQHFKKIAQSVAIPIILYSIPGRCGIEIPIETVAQLHQDAPNIVAIKEAGVSVARVEGFHKVMPSSFQILSGDDALTLPFLKAGAVGLVSVASNLIPEVMTTMVTAFLQKNETLANELQEEWKPLFKELFVETNPVPIKTALASLSYMQEEFRLPLVPLTPEHREEFLSFLQTLPL